MMRPCPRRLHLAILLTCTALLAAACGPNGATSDGSTADSTTTDDAPASGERALSAQVASFDLTVGEDRRLQVGILASDQSAVLVGGEVQFRIAPLGDDPEGGSPDALSDPIPARFLPVPGNEPEAGGQAVLHEGGGAGVYVADVDFDQPGFWAVRVTATVDGEEHIADARFQVREEPIVPSVGDPAPRVETPTAESWEGPLTALDSSAQGENATLTAPHLHEVSIPDAIEAGRPVVVVISTPVYCLSRFCGPITQTISEMALEYEEKAEFVFLEVWENFQEEKLNTHVQEWIWHEDIGGNEPWVFLVDAEGNIAARWDNVLDEAALRSMLDDLPPMQ